MNEPVTPLEMLNRLIAMGLVTPVTEHPNLMMPTLYRTVPTMASSGTGHTSFDARHNDAELYGTNEGNIQHPGSAS